MKKLLFMLALLALTVGGLSSCRKCVHCKATKAGQPDVDNGQFCGSYDDVEIEEDSFRLFMEATGYKVSCF